MEILPFSSYLVRAYPTSETSDNFLLHYRRSASSPTTRIKEAAGRSKAITDFRIGMIQAQAFLMSTSKQLENDTASGEPSKYTELELTTLEGSISSNESWLSELEKKQAILKRHDDPVLRIAELERRTRELAAQLAVLKAKRPPRKLPKKISPSKTIVTSVTTSDLTATTSAESEQVSASEVPVHERNEL